MHLLCVFVSTWQRVKYHIDIFSGVASGSRAAGRSALASVKERYFYARRVLKTDTLKKTNGTTSHTRLTRPARPAVLLSCLSCCPAVLHTTHTKYAHPCGLLHYLRSPVHRVSRAQLPAVCTVCHRMPFAHSQARKTRNTRKNGMR